VSEEQAVLRNNALAEHGYDQLDFDSAEIKRQSDQAAAVIEKLKNTGWLFASSTYNNINLRENSLETISLDTEKWLNQIGTLTGRTEILNYPLGAFLDSSDQKLDFLIDSGFCLFAGQGTTPYRIYQDGFIYVDRLPINGFTMRQADQYKLDRLFDVEEVYDNKNRP
jgi:hypothetical protein